MRAGALILYAESYSAMLHDGKTASGWSINDAGFAALDTSRHSQPHAHCASPIEKEWRKVTCAITGCGYNPLARASGGIGRRPRLRTVCRKA